MKSELIQIPKYTLEDFTETDAPYAFLFQYVNEPFVLAQLLHQAKKMAGNLGFRSFMGYWKAYLQSKDSRNIRAENATQYDNQPVELMSGPYICDDLGVTLNTAFGERVICQHAIMPVRRLINIDNGEERLELAYKKGNTWRRIIVEKASLASSQIIQLAAYGIMVNTDNAKDLSTFIFALEQLNYEMLPEVKSVSRLGWVKDGFSPFVDGLVFDGEQNYRYMYEAVKEKGKRDKWLDAMREFRAEKTIGRVFLAASFASVLLEPLGLLPFFVHAWGTTGSGKTVCLMAAASVWGAPDGNGLMTTFNATDVGQEMVAGFLNNLPMCIDELQIQTSAGIRDFDRMIYKLTEGKGKTRGAKSGGLRPTLTWRNCMLTTGEAPITHAGSAGGAINRIIEFECYDPVSSDLHRLAGIVKENYGFAGREFVEYLQQPGVLDTAKTVQQNYYAELNKYDSTEKLAASASAILTADALITQLLFKDHNELTVKDLVEIMASSEEVDVNKRILDFVYELVASNPAHFDGKDNAEVWGYTTGDRIYIIKRIFDRELSNEGYSSASFLAWAKRHNYIFCDSDGRRTKKVRIGDSCVNTVCIKREIPTGFTPME